MNASRALNNRFCLIVLLTAYSDLKGGTPRALQMTSASEIFLVLFLAIVLNEDKHSDSTRVL